jgi:proteasome lid subunit RPN8/RPN11
LIKYRIRASQLDNLIKHATSRAKKGSREIAGLIVDNQSCLDLIECKNKSQREGSFSFYFREVRRIVKAAEILNYEAIGTFHSHPVGLAEPGESDIANSENDSLMLIIDCTDRRAKLWRIKHGNAKKVKFRLIP